jgi:acyl carrier protein
LTEKKFPPELAAGDRRIYLTGDLGRIGDGQILEHKGRGDHMVKISGYRVEMNEVVGALLNLQSVKDAFVVAREEQPGNSKLVAYIIPSHDPSASTSELREELSKSLPDYMIPGLFIQLEKFPKTITGKVDMEKLPVVTRDVLRIDALYEPPMTVIERRISKIWAEVLNLDKVGIHDRFLEVGGNSLLATAIVSRILHEFELSLSASVLYSAESVKELGEIIENQELLDIKNLDRMLSEIEEMSDDEVKKVSG